LRERTDDIPLLVDHFIEMFSNKYQKKRLKLSNETFKKLQSYHWPGNIRELQHAIERAIILSESDTLHADDFLFTPKVAENEVGDFDDYNLDHIEKVFIRKTLKKHRGNVTKAANELGLSRAALYRRMEKHGL
jgi:transcriptional regulator with PAS, ATPase and Fis domain